MAPLGHGSGPSATLAYLDLTSSDPVARGTEHGRSLKPQIVRNVETCYRRLANTGVDRPAARERAAGWLKIAERSNPTYCREMAAVAAAAGLHLLDLATLNFRFELLFPLLARRLASQDEVGGRDGCTSFGLRRTSGGASEVVIGQTLDGIEAIAGNLAVIRSVAPNGGTMLGLHEAGSVGPSVGLNSNGIGVVYNTLMTRDCIRPAAGAPFRLRTLQILQSQTYAQALAAALHVPRPTSTHLLLGHRDGEIVGLELTSTKAAYLHPEDGIVTHANHFERCSDVTSLFERMLPSSLFRGARLRRLLSPCERADDRAIELALSDHFSYPSSICQHAAETAPPDRRGVTLAGIVINLSAGTMAVANGTPCCNKFEKFHLNT